MIRVRLRHSMLEVVLLQNHLILVFFQELRDRVLDLVVSINLLEMLPQSAHA